MARTTQIENEKHSYRLLKMEREYMIQDVRKMTSELLKLDGNKDTKNSNLQLLIARMNKLKTTVKWDEKTIEALEESIAEKTEDNDLLKLFSKEDQKEAHELEIKRQRLREEELARRQLVIRLANEIECLQLSLGRNVQMYKQMNDERNVMVQQWQNSVKQLQQRNKETISILHEIEELHNIINTSNQSLESERQFVNNLKSNNNELEIQIANGRHEYAKLKLLLKDFMSIFQDRNIELAGLGRELRSVASSLESERAAKHRHDNLIKDAEKSLKDIVNTVDKLRQQLISVTQSNMSAEDRTRHLDELIHEEEQIHKSFIYDIERMQGLLFRSQKTLVDLKDTYKVKELSHTIYEQGLVTLQKQIVQTESESYATKENLYKFNFRANMLESRLSRVLGQHHDIDIEVHQARLRELEKTMANVSEAEYLLQSQIYRLEDDMRRLAKSTNEDAEALSNMRSRLQDRLLMVDGAVKQVAQKRTRNNKYRVENNVLAVRLKGAERVLKREGGVVFGLQRQQLEMQAVVQERIAEIKIQRDLFMIKRRALLDDIGRMRGDFQGRRIRIDQLKKRLECVLESIGKSEDGEPLSIAYFRIRNAQEKYGLQQEGDRLDGLIRKTEREIVAMENTLRVVNESNDLYKNALSALEEDGDEIAECRHLEELLNREGSQMRSKNTELLERGKIIRTMRGCLANMREHLREATQKYEDKIKIVNEMQCDNDSRQIMIQRAEAAAKLTPCNVCNDAYKDMILKQLRDVNKSALQQLVEVSVRFLETGPVINQYLSENKIPLLSASSLSRSSRHSLGSISSSTSRRSEDSNSSAISAVTLTLNIP